MLVTLNFNLFNSFSNCEMCGCYSNVIASVNSETHEAFGEYSTGSYAHCYDVEEADYNALIEEVFTRLETIGVTVPRPEWKMRPVNEELEARFKAEIIDRGLLDRQKYPTWGSWPEDTNWDLYWEYDFYKDHEYEEKFYTFFEHSMDLSNPDSFVSYLEQHGIQVIVEFVEDEYYDVDWNDDYKDDSEE